MAKKRTRRTKTVQKTKQAPMAAPQPAQEPLADELQEPVGSYDRWGMRQDNDTL